MVEFMRVSEVFGRLWFVNKLGSKLIRNIFEVPHETLPSTVTAKCKSDTADNLLLKRKNLKMKNANAQNNTFASSDTQADASACKRVVFLPTLRQNI